MFPVAGLHLCPLYFEIKQVGDVVQFPIILMTVAFETVTQRNFNNSSVKTKQNVRKYIEVDLLRKRHSLGMRY